MIEAIQITEARQCFLPLITKVEKEGYRFIVSKHGAPVAVVLNYAEYTRMIETLRLVGDLKRQQHLGESISQEERGVVLEVNSSRGKIA